MKRLTLEYHVFV